MSTKLRGELTAELLKKSIEDGKSTSMTQLAHSLGYKGSVSSSLTRKFRLLVPDINALLAANKAVKVSLAPQASKPVANKAAQKATKPKANKSVPKASPAKSDKPKDAKAVSKWAHDERSKFRPGSCYDRCFSILAAHKNGLPRVKLIELLAETTNKDLVHAGYDAQVLLSASGNETGLNRNEGPRHRSCRPGFWVKRTNGHVQLMVD